MLAGGGSAGPAPSARVARMSTRSSRSARTPEARGRSAVGRPAAPPLSSLETLETLRTLVRNLREGVYITSPEGEILDANPAMLAMFGVRKLAELGRHRIQEWIDQRQREREHAILERRGVVRDFEFTFRRPNGELRTVIDTALARRDGPSGRTVYIGVLIDITERKQLERQLHDIGRRDPLTGCFNRRFLQGFEAEAPPGRGWACVIVDVDHFKEYNDRHGHERGDEVLVRVGRFLGSVCRAGDAVVRLGGDEFMVLLAGVRGPTLERVVRRLGRAGRAGVPVPFSLGWAARWQGERLEQTMARADRRLLAIRVAERRELRRGGAPPGRGGEGGSR
jgi:diguanylate cyclase (GGDEF)-like protein/PAS domain S-box-containing protein